MPRISTPLTFHLNIRSMISTKFSLDIHLLLSITNVVLISQLYRSHPGAVDGFQVGIKWHINFILKYISALWSHLVNSMYINAIFTIIVRIFNSTFRVFCVSFLRFVCCQASDKNTILAYYFLTTMHTTTL